jgi:hypothetical protein
MPAYIQVRTQLIISYKINILGVTFITSFGRHLFISLQLHRAGLSVSLMQNTRFTRHQDLQQQYPFFKNGEQEVK